MIIAVGSLNPLKHDAVKIGFSKVWPNESLEIVPAKVSSDVSEQPLTGEETLLGSKTRAKAALDAISKADYGVGIEGGLHQLNDDWFSCSWITIIDRQGNIGRGASASCPIPAHLMELVHQGKHMSEVCRIIYGVQDLGTKQGYFGLMTNNAITRTSGYADGVIMAMANFITPSLGGESD